MVTAGPTLVHGDERVDLLPHVEQAIAELGWVRPEAALWLAHGIATYSDRDPGRAIRKDRPANAVEMALTTEGQRDAAVRFDGTANYALKLAMAEARWAQIQRIKGARPYARYIAVNDRRTDPRCAARHDTVLPVDHPWWRSHRPPTRWDCRCSLQSLSERDLVRYGFKLSATPPD